MPTILVVDDIEGVHEMLDIVFEGSEFRLVHAMSAAEAIAKFNAQSIDLILSDVQMPGGDGLSMLADLRELDPDVVAIITTASDSREFVIRALRLGAFDFVQKPYDEEVLLDSVRRGFKEVERRRRLSLSSAAMLQEELEALRKELMKREDALTAVQEKEAEIQHLRDQLAIRQERDLELRKRQMELDAREGAMRTMDAVIQERLQTLTHASHEAGGGGGGLSLDEIQKLEELREQLEARENQIQEQEASLMEREANLMENEESLMEKGQRLIELETELEQIREDLTNRGGGGAPKGGGSSDLSEEEQAEILEIKASLEAKEAALRELEEKIAERERAIRKAEMLIKAREQFLAESESILFGGGSAKS